MCLLGCGRAKSVGVDGMVIIGQRSSESTFGAYEKFKHANMQLIEIQNSNTNVDCVVEWDGGDRLAMGCKFSSASDTPEEEQQPKFNAT